MHEPVEMMETSCSEDAFPESPVAEERLNGSNQDLNLVTEERFNTGNQDAARQLLNSDEKGIFLNETFNDANQNRFPVTEKRLSYQVKSPIEFCLNEDYPDNLRVGELQKNEYNQNRTFNFQEDNCGYHAKSTVDETSGGKNINDSFIVERSDNDYEGRVPIVEEQININNRERSFVIEYSSNGSPSLGERSRNQDRSFVIEKKSIPTVDEQNTSSDQENTFRVEEGYNGNHRITVEESLEDNRNISFIIEHSPTKDDSERSTVVESQIECSNPNKSFVVEKQLRSIGDSQNKSFELEEEKCSISNSQIRHSVEAPTNCPDQVKSPEKSPEVNQNECNIVENFATTGNHQRLSIVEYSHSDIQNESLTAEAHLKTTSEKLPAREENSGVAEERLNSGNQSRSPVADALSTAIAKDQDKNDAGIVNDVIQDTCSITEVPSQHDNADILVEDKTLVTEEPLSSNIQIVTEKSLNSSDQFKSPVKEEKRSYTDKQDKPVDSNEHLDTCTQEGFPVAEENFDNPDTPEKENSSSHNQGRSLDKDKVLNDDNQYKLLNSETQNRSITEKRLSQSYQGVEVESQSELDKLTSPDCNFKMTDSLEKLNQQQAEISDLKLKLNAVQQHNASLELQIRQNEEIVIKTQAEALRTEQNYQQEVKQLKEKLNENSKIIEKDRICELEEQVKAKEAKLLAEISQRSKEEINFQEIMEQSNIMMKSLSSECKKLREDNKMVKTHLTNLELAFSDVHSKYEKTKTGLVVLRENEESLLRSLEVAQSTNIQHEERYESLKAHATTQIEKANKENHALKEHHEAEINKLRAVARRLEIKVSSLEVSLQQKSEECEQLSALCDEVTGKRM